MSLLAKTRTSNGVPGLTAAKQSASQAVAGTKLFANAARRCASSAQVFGTLVNVSMKDQSLSNCGWQQVSQWNAQAAEFKYKKLEVATTCIVLDVMCTGVGFVGWKQMDMAITIAYLGATVNKMAWDLVISYFFLYSLLCYFFCLLL